ncbi:NUDIX hydrolase [Bacillus shivajii]|uniref:NUDIX domain-containing protein n=1 Tax=Bacillus shivajii TaxID=1983719 RepID=UPI001CF99602|nr:NUDIX hydrolase [Bacillus shivajii]UCZ55108.1 NUDIX hydrolase [Bacillus shivajii]
MIRKAVGAIVFQKNKFLLVHKTKVNTLEGKRTVKGEWDFVKGGVEKSDKDLSDAIVRELHEETGSTKYEIVKVFDEKISFDFPKDVKVKIGYDKQETTMFLVEFFGDVHALIPNDHEISDVTLIEKNKVVDILTHQDTKEFFIKHLKI